MVPEIVVVVAGEEREEEATPEFAQILPHGFTALTDAIGELGVGAGLPRSESEETVGGEERDASRADPVEAGDDGDATSAARRMSASSYPPCWVAVGILDRAERLLVQQRFSPAGR
jgi:hypothetical protein